MSTTALVINPAFIPTSSALFGITNSIINRSVKSSTSISSTIEILIVTAVTPALNFTGTTLVLLKSSAVKIHVYVSFQ